jgi:hypothetical protein
MPANPPTIAQRLERFLIAAVENESATLQQRLDAAAQLAKMRTANPPRKRRLAKLKAEQEQIKAAPLPGILGTR